MRLNKTVKKRVFSIEAISEEEAVVLRTLLNLSKDGVRNKLNSDRLYWNDDLSEDDAVRIGLDICKDIMNIVDDRS